MLKKIILFICLLNLAATVGFSQKENNIWYFGANAGLDFNSGAPVPLTNGQLNTTEGCASVADANGNLLFYTEGVNVWNSSHTIMPNGSGLLGGTSSSQSALIIAQPGSTSLYYIFTVPNQGAPGGMCYSLVDMNLQGGLGDITNKNVPLHSTVTEKLHGTRHQNGTDYWIVVHEAGSDAFYAYLLTAAGVNPVPVISNTGIIHATSIGYLKISGDGARLVISINASSEVELFDFDNFSGVVSNPITFPTIYIQPYGLEFSADNSKLYVAEAGNQAGPVGIYQFDMLAGSPAAILASAVLIGSSANNYLGPLQLGPDCKIYVARYQTGYLGVINDPNQSGIAANFVDSGVYLGGQQSTYGLPNLISTCSGAASVTGTCLGDSTYFAVPSTTNLLGAQWDFDDPASGIYNQSFVFNPVHYFATSGTYQVQLIRFYTTYTDTAVIPVTIKPLPLVSLGPDTSLCSGSSILVYAGSGFSSYLWQDNSTDTVLTVTQPGAYWVTVGQDGCYATDTLNVTSAVCNVPGVNFISSDTVFCDKKCLDFTDLSTNSPSSWYWLFPGAVPASDTVQHPTNICYNAYGTFDVTLIACNAAGCDTLHISSFITEYQLPPQPVITQSNDTLYCTPAFNYAWYNTSNPGIIISTDSFYTSSAGGSFFVIVGDSLGCQNASAIFSATGLSDNLNATGVWFYPNPVTDELQIHTNLTIREPETEIRITTVPGQVIYRTTFKGNEVNVNTGQVANGIYFLYLQKGPFIYISKFIVNR